MSTCKSCSYSLELSHGWYVDLDDNVDVMTCAELVVYLSDGLKFRKDDIKELESEYSNYVYVAASLIKFTCNF